jgi:hypothetical protein
MLSLLAAVPAMLWTEAGPEQRRMTIQLVRNSAYFGLAIYLIRNYGDRVAI